MRQVGPPPLRVLGEPRERSNIQTVEARAAAPRCHSPWPRRTPRVSSVWSEPSAPTRSSASASSATPASSPRSPSSTRRWWPNPRVSGGGGAKSWTLAAATAGRIDDADPVHVIVGVDDLNVNIRYMKGSLVYLRAETNPPLRCMMYSSMPPPPGQEEPSADDSADGPKTPGQDETADLPTGPAKVLDDADASHALVRASSNASTTIRRSTQLAAGRRGRSRSRAT